jgi:hypothetical protein
MKIKLIMKKIAITALILIGLFVSCKVTHAPTPDLPPQPHKVLLYEGVWGTIYHAEVRQCDDTPLITGDGSRINPYKASEHRWIAITHNMLQDQWRRSMIDTTQDGRFAGKIEYGDTIWIESPYPQLNGWWVVRDTKNKRYTEPTIDFLQTKNDGTLYEDNPQWSGKWEDIKIFAYNGRT